MATSTVNNSLISRLVHREKKRRVWYTLLMHAYKGSTVTNPGIRRKKSVILYGIQA